MKKLLLAALAVLGFTAFAPTAHAGQFARVYDGYGYTYVPKAALYGYGYAPTYCEQPRHRRHRIVACEPAYADCGRVRVSSRFYRPSIGFYFRP